MTLVNHETGEILDAEQAERRATQIGLALDGAADRFEAAMEKMRAAIKDRDDLALGYRSPGDYLSERFGGKLARLGVDLRREVVRELTEAGLSTRAIAPVVDVSPRQVVSDQRAAGVKSLHTSSSPRGQEASTASSSFSGSDERGEEKEQPAEPAPAVVIGIDGKKYQQKSERPRQAQRDDAEVLLNSVRSLADQAARAAAKLTPAQIARVTPKADLWTVGLGESLEALQRLLTSLTEEK